MTKRILTLILTLCLAITAMTVVSFGETLPDSEFQYEVSQYDSKATITGYTGTGGDITIPSEIVGYEVVAIGDRAFQYANITSVSIPETVRTIGSLAFRYCGNLISVTLSEGLEEIGAAAFLDCTYLKSIFIPSSVNYISGLAFYNTALTEVTLSCGTTYESDSFPDGCTIIQPAHTYSGGTCTVCGKNDSDYVKVGSAELHDGYYTVDGVNAVYGTPDSTVTSYAYYDASVSTLYLSNFTYTTAGTTAYSATIKPSESDLTISLSGNNTIGGETYGINSSVGSITLVSTDTENMGSLTINANSSLAVVSRGIYCSRDVVIDGVSVTISSASQSVYAHDSVTIKNGAVYSANNRITSDDNTTITGSKVTVSNEYGGLSGNYVYISSSEVVLSGEKAIDCDESLYITASDVTLIGKIVVDEEAVVTPANNSLWQIDLGTSETSYKSSVINDETNYGDDWEDYTYVRVAKHEHSYTSEVTTEATCTEKGVTTYACICGDSYITEIPATGHSYEAVVTEPTCTEGGYTTYTCSACGDSYVADETPATEHTTEVQNAKDATCTEDGYTGDEVCTVCGETVTTGEVIPATGHSYEAVVTEPTCTEGGYTTYTCSACGDSYVADETAATGHTTEVQNAKDATCTEDGYTGDEVCTVCGETVTTGEVIPATGHSYEAVVTDPTCTEGGYTTYTCSICGDSYVADETEATGHNYVVTAFTWNSGYKSATVNLLCTDCGEEHSEAVDADASQYMTAETTEETTDNETTEEVVISEPVEDTDTEPEPDEVEAEEPETETNPTTGIILAMLPMAIAMAAIVVGKRK